MSATVSPLLTPSLASPPARASERSRTSPQVIEMLSSRLRSATSSGFCSVVIRNASATVGASIARLPAAWVAVLPSMLVPPSELPSGERYRRRAGRRRHAPAGAGTSGGEGGSGGATLRARALVPGEPGLTHHEQRPRDQTDLPPVRVGLRVPGAASLLHDRGLHPCSLRALSPFRPALLLPYDEGLTRYLRQETGAKKKISPPVVEPPAAVEIQARRPTAPRAPRSPTQPTHATHPTQLTHPTHAVHARHPRFAMPATMAALPSTPALSVTAALPTTPALATVPALQATPALASVPALPITPALLTVPTLAITPALSTVPALPRTPALPAVAVEPAGPTPSSVRGSGVPGLIASGTRRPGAGRCRC